MRDSSLLEESKSLLKNLAERLSPLAFVSYSRIASPLQHITTAARVATGADTAKVLLKARQLQITSGLSTFEMRTNEVPFRISFRAIRPSRDICMNV